MAFQTNVQAPDMVSLALNLMQMKRQADLEERKMALDEARLQAEQRRQEIQDHRDSIQWGLDMQRQGLEIDNAKREAGLKATADLAGPLSIVLDPAATQPEQSMAAQSYLPQLMDRAKAMDPTGGADLGRYLNQAGIQAGGMVASSLASDRKALSAKESDLSLEDKFAQKREARAEAARIREEKRAAEAASLQQEAEDNALRAGKWDGKDLDKAGAAQETRLSYTPDVTRSWNRLSRLDPNKPNDIYEMTYMVQKQIDQGGVVRESDVNMWKQQGFSGFDSALAKAQSLYDKTKRYPEGFGADLKRTLEGILESQDQKTVDLDDEFNDYANRNNWTPAMRERANRFQKQKELARKRLASKGLAPATDQGGVPSGFKPHPTVPGLYVNDKGEGYVP